ncbi:MAG: hypoxanthine phosphoribosyltransferase [Bacteroidetes bacterium 4572_77]|nr:MAG: hypoxanthine phosphoribosyltransferase [Bacteroidetes bacterium 4572_77]
MEAKTVKLHDKEFKISIPAAQIDTAVSQVAAKINKDYKGKNPLFVIVLNGAFMFASDMLKKITIDCEITFVKLSSYVGTKTTHSVRELIGLDESLAGRNVILVEDIIDTGITMANTIPKMQHLNAKDVKIATLLFKPKAFQKDFEIDYVGIEIGNDFIVGYGLDYDGLGRNLADIYKIIE